jgi:hypothetical protein
MVSPRARVMARIDVARAELQAAAQDPLASAEVLDAAGVANIGGVPITTDDDAQHVDHRDDGGGKEDGF